MKKKLLIVSIVVIIVLLGSIVGILIYNNIQDKKEKAKIADAYRKAHAPKYIKFTDNAGKEQVELYFTNMKFIKGIDILEYDRDNVIINKYSDLQSIGENKLQDILIKTQKDTKNIQVHIWIKYLDRKEYSFSSFNLKRNVAKRSKNGDTIYVTLSADFDTGIFNPRSQSQLPEYIKVRD